MCALRGNPLTGPAQTAASIALGSMAAALQMLEIERILRGRSDGSILGLESYHDLASRAAATTRLVRADGCRFDHPCQLPEFVPDLDVAELAAKVRDARSVSILHRRFVLSVACKSCPRRPVEVWRFVRDAGDCEMCCPACGSALSPTGMDLLDGVPLAELTPDQGSRRLSGLGVREGDLLLVEGADGPRAFELQAAAGGEGANTRSGDALRTIVVVGLGNIGSNTVDALVRTLSLSIDRLILIDPDSYDRCNLAGQRIEATDVGQPKAIVQARHVLRRRPFLVVVAYVSRVEDVPAGVLRDTLVAGCVDSRAARQSLAEMAWRMGAPLVDAAVEATIPAVRIAGYVPGPLCACLECSFHDDDYAAIEQRIACQS